jgi:hypothetical protein
MRLACSVVCSFRRFAEVLLARRVVANGSRDLLAVRRQNEPAAIPQVPQTNSINIRFSSRASARDKLARAAPRSCRGKYHIPHWPPSACSCWSSRGVIA